RRFIDEAEWGRCDEFEREVWISFKSCLRVDGPERTQCLVRSARPGIDGFAGHGVPPDRSQRESSTCRREGRCEARVTSTESGNVHGRFSAGRHFGEWWPNQRA